MENEEPKVEEKPEVQADEVTPVTICENCQNSGKECLVCGKGKEPVV